ncbi:hypothetical protein OHA04_45520 (plasmid) [Streptomyces sp. NBC_01590]|uniref:hypothetical protein n=1 Tax=Streptomyces sp. NBC_01590 TaxID=2975887 RepID=UPI002F906AA4
MDLNREPQQMIRAAAEEVRCLNHGSMDVEAFYGEYNVINAAPNQVAGVIMGLYTLFERLPQSVEQAAAALAQLEADEAIRMANGADVNEATSGVLRSLIDAKQAILVAQTHLREASGIASNMGGHFIDDDELEDTDATV